MHLSELSRTSIRAIPGIQQLIDIKQAHGKEIGHFSGKFESREEALASAAPEMRSTWDDEALVTGGIATFSSIHVFDWPVIFYLQQRVKDGTLDTVTDFGGHIGVKYRAYRQVIEFPSEMRWQVVEVPAVIREAKRRMTAEERALRFFERMEDAESCDVLLCSGSLQYTEFSVEQLVARMPKRPGTIILNKMPVSRKEAFFTVERYVKSLAYRIYGPNDLDDGRSRMGYTLTARWTIPHRDIVVLHSKRAELVEMVGEVWTL